MAKKKISDMTPFIDLESTDLLHLADLSEGKSIKMAISDLVTYLESVLAIDVNVDTFTYDDTTKILTITETDGTTHDVNISDLVDNLPTGTADGDVLTWDNTAGEWVVSTAPAAHVPSSLTDNGDGTFTHNNGYGTTVNIDTNKSIDDLTDVDTSTTTPTVGQALIWDGTQWIAQTVDSGATEECSDFIYLQESSFNLTGFSFDTSAQETNPTGLYFNGTNFYVVGSNDDNIDEYDLNGTYTGNTYSTGLPNPRDIEFDGTHYWIPNNNTDRIHQFDSSFTPTGFSFDVSANITSPNGITIKDNNLWIIDSATGLETAYEYTTSGVYTGNSFSVDGVGNFATGIHWDGNSFWVIDNSEILVEYNSSGVATGKSIYIDVGSTNISDIQFDGSKLYILSLIPNKGVLEYDLVESSKITDSLSNGTLGTKFNVNDIISVSGTTSNDGNYYITSIIDGDNIEVNGPLTTESAVTSCVTKEGVKICDC